MKVFAARYLEEPSKDVAVKTPWTWIPENVSVIQIYASGAPTATQQSTYAAETDNRGDTDRPNEGLSIV